MKFLSDYFNSGSVRQQNKKRLAALAVCATAALLAVALIALMIGSIATAIKNKAPDGTESGDETGTKIPTGYTTANFAEAGYSIHNGTLLQVDATHSFTGSTAKVELPQSGRPSDGNEPIYSAQFTGNTALIQEALDAFHTMITDFHAAVKNEEGYRIGYLYVMDPTLTGIEFSDDTKAVQQTGTTVTLSYAVAEGKKASIYDSATKTGVGAYKWIYDNAYKYGFIQVSTAEGEENVFRYVGVAHAAYMKNNNKTFSDYLALFQTNKPTASRPLTVSVKDAKGNTVKYNMYYLSSTEEAVVPTKYNYTVSGDNMGGYIVTVDTSSAATTK